MKTSNPFINYGIATILAENNLVSIDEITKQHLKEALEHGITHFRVKPETDNFQQETIQFQYCDIEKGNPKMGIYLAPSILASDKGAGNVYKELKALLSHLKSDKIINVEITRAIAPVSAEFSSFGKNSIGRGKPKTSLQTAIFCAITTTTAKKPSLAFKILKKDKPEMENLAIIPDLPIPELVDFILLFEQLKLAATTNLLIGNINQKDKKPSRPRLFDGNFPNAPRSNSLGAIALLGAIGAWAKDAGKIEWANKVLESLKERPIYMIGTKTFETFTFNHFVIDMAKDNRLSSIIDSIFYVVLYNQGFRNFNSRLEYQKFDFFVARFLQLFNRPAFKDFLAFRAEYPNQLETLLKTYFIHMEKIDAAVVQSAQELGKWLNYAAYKIANQAIDEKAQNRRDKVIEQKAKFLVEFESSIFSARSGDALIFQAITRAGRASGLDAPSEAELFMTKVSTGEISLDSAKHLLIAFSRVKNKFEPKEAKSIASLEETSNEEEMDADDSSDAQE
ncbi:MAG: type I-PGING CRISPR-associated protein Cas8c/Csp2 [Raineya sp.]|jgi:CRISPR-associated protein Cas8c/Csp2|nr:type I-PGING CRISPR-associated protein Cas8c/Csp2 [Raineya sp.]